MDARPAINPAPRKWFWTIVISCLCLQAVFAVDCARRWTPTHDEYWHLPIGVAMWRQSRTDFDCINPPLPRLWAAAPVIAAGYPMNEFAPNADTTAIGDAFWRPNPSGAQNAFFLARCVHLVWMMAAGILLAMLARDWLGDIAGCVAVGLWVTCPTITAHGAVVTHDMPVTTAFLLSTWCATRVGRCPGWPTGGWLGVAIAIGLLSKFTAVLIIPAAAAVWLVTAVRSGAGVGSVKIAQSGVASTPSDSRAASAPARSQAPAETTSSAKSSGRQHAFAVCSAIVVAWSLLAIGYGGRGIGQPLSSLPLKSPQFLAWQKSFGNIPLPVPADFVRGFDALAHFLTFDQPVFLADVWSLNGWPTYYLWTLALKLPVSILAAAVVAVIYAALLFRDPTGFWRPMAVSLFIAGCVLIPASLQRNQLGIRYILPAIPFLFLAMSGPLQRLWLSPGLGGRAVIVLLMLGGSVEAVLAHPHEMAHFNLIAGGRDEGRFWLVDSNLDWGQDLHAARDLVAREGWTEYSLAYFGSVPPDSLGMQFSLPPRMPKPGKHLISANFVMGRPHGLRDAAGSVHLFGVNEFAYWKFVTPVRNLGGSILVFDLTAADIREFNAKLATGLGR